MDQKHKNNFAMAIAKLDDDELNYKLATLKEELFNIRFTLAAKSEPTQEEKSELEKYKYILTQIKKEIALIKTEMIKRQRERGK